MPKKSFSLYLVLGLLLLLALMVMNTSHSTAVIPAHAARLNHVAATHHVIRLNQLDCQQYLSQQDCVTWSPSTCSATSMTEVMNFFGRAYRIADVLKVEAGFVNPTVITPDSGLLYTGGLDRTLHAFGFQTRTLQHPTVAQLVAAATTAPIIINFPPDRWPGGHFLVVTGGNASHVQLADSSRFNMTSMSIAAFLKYWAGFAVQVTLGGQQ